MAVFKNAVFYPETANFIQSAGITDETQMKAIGRLVGDLKFFNLWNKMRAVYPFIGQAGVSSSFEVNLKDPNTFRGTFNGGWNFTSTGVTGNGTDTYMDTFIVPETHLNKNSTHLSIYSRTDLAGNTFDIGSTTATGTEVGVHIAMRYTGTFYPRIFDSNAGISNTSTLGFFMGNRQDNTTIKARRNTVEDTITSNTVTSNINNFKVYIGCVNVAGSPFAHSSRNYAFASIGDGLTDTDAANLYTAVQRFQTTLGRQV